jgi:hypothetical protein
MAPKVKDWTGHTQGRLTVLHLSRTAPEPSGRGNYYYWLCQCECGNTKEVEAVCFYGVNNVRSCGCFRKELQNTTEWKRKNVVVGSAFQRVLTQYKQNAKNRNIPWELTEEEFRTLTSSPCHYTGALPANVKKCKSGEEYVYNGVDRVDNNKGYTTENCVACCTEINLMKLDMTQEHFLELCFSVSERFSNVVSDYKSRTIH